MFFGLLRFLFPEHCIGCGRPGTALCSHCIDKIPFAAGLPHGSYAVFDYGNRYVRATIRALKYHHRSESAHVLARAAIPHINEYLSDTLQTMNPEKIAFVPIPEHRRKVKDRGFNQSTLIATWWSKAIVGSTIISSLHKTVFTLPQARLNRHARMKNVADTMMCPALLDSTLVYIVVDDVTTTGATFAEARRALAVAGAKKIICIALAHGYARK